MWGKHLSSVLRVLIVARNFIAATIKVRGWREERLTGSLVVKLTLTPRRRDKEISAGGRQRIKPVRNRDVYQRERRILPRRPLEPREKVFHVYTYINPLPNPSS